ncbi:MAG: hypothetical protein JWO58_1313 [Chitinophagaceae bacterium]|nr:hypothetical protein [Chitinophagaceae bacterium]
MGNEISINIEHNDNNRLQSFLRSVKYPLEEVPFDWSSWQYAAHIVGGKKYHTSTLPQPAILTVLLCDSYDDANAIGKANEMLANSSHARWGLNGSILYFVESEDEDKVSELVSLFAGEE